ncbi:MAG: WD40 repeat domain-containing protein, partial [Anaerolineales bacterium]
LLVEEPLQEAYFTDLSIDSKGSRVAFLEQRYGCFPTGYCTNLWLYEVTSGRTDNPITGEDFTRDTFNGGDIARGLAGIEYPTFSYSIPIRMISALTVSPDGSRLAAGTSGGSISLWDADSGEALDDVSYQQLPVFQIQFTPDGNRLFAASFDGSLIAVNTVSGELEYRSYETPERFQSMALAPSGQWLVMGGGQELRLLSVRGDAIKLALYRRFDDGPIRALAFSPDSSLLAVGTGDGTVWLLSVPEGEVLLRLVGHSGRVLQLAFSPQGDLLASAAEDRVLNVWQLNSQPAGEYHPGLLLSAVYPEWVGDMAFSPDGSTLASLAFNRKVYFLRLDDLTPGAAQRVIASGVLAHLSFSPDSQQLYLTSDRNVFRIDARLDEGLFRPVDDYEAP